jgi:CRP-like cAMP-binding protein
MKEIEDLKNTLRKLTGEEAKELAELDKLCTLKHYGKNEFFLESNSVPIYSAFIVKGAFREYYTDNNGREFNKAFGFEGDFTGSYYDLVVGKPSIVSIQALTNSTVVAIRYAEYKKLISTDIFWLKVEHAFAHNLLMKKFEKEYQLLTLSATERYELLQKQYPALEQLVPAYHIASYLGITPISLSRIRAQLKK